MPADAQVGAGSGGGAVGKRDIHTPSISVQNGEDGRQSRGRRRRSACPGRDDWHDGGVKTASAATDTGSHSRGGGGRRSNIDNSTSPRAHGRQNHRARQAPEHRRLNRHGATVPYDTWHSLRHLHQVQIQHGGRGKRINNLPTGVFGTFRKRVGGTVKVGTPQGVLS